MWQEKTITYNELAKLGNPNCEEFKGAMEWLKEQVQLCIRYASGNHHGKFFSDCECKVSDLYALVCKEKPQWKDWMLQHFTDEVLGIKSEPKEWCCERFGNALKNDYIKHIEDDYAYYTDRHKVFNIYHCPYCGAKLQPPKKEEVFKINEKLNISGATNPVTIFGVLGANQVCLINSNGYVYLGRFTSIRDFNKITEAELRKIVGNATIERVN